MRSAIRSLVSAVLSALYSLRTKATVLHTQQQLESLDPIRKLSGDAVESIDSAEYLQTESWLRSKLRRFPYWEAGHLELAALALRHGDGATAYASSQAALQLASSDAQRRRAKLLTARALLSSDAAARALPLLEDLHRADPASASITEDLAGACLATGDHVRARSLLETIGEGEITPSGKAALLWLQRRDEGKAE